jgi:hypothetical protein
VRNTQRGRFSAAPLRVILRDLGHRRLLREPRFWGFAILITATSVAMANVSLWLLPPYWAIVFWLVHDPARIRQAGAAASATPPAHVRRQGRERGAAAPHVALRRSHDAPAQPTCQLQAGPVASSSPLAATAHGAAGEGSVTPARRRRTGTRAAARSRATGSSLPPPTSSWVQVAPGKYVRIEGPASQAGAGAEQPDPASRSLDPAPSAGRETSAETSAIPESRPEPDDRPVPLCPEVSSVCLSPASPPGSLLAEPAGADGACTEIPQAGEHGLLASPDAPLVLAPEAAAAEPDASEFDGDSLQELVTEETRDEEGKKPRPHFEIERSTGRRARVYHDPGSRRRLARARRQIRQRGSRRGRARFPRQDLARRSRRFTRHSRAPP